MLHAIEALPVVICITCWIVCCSACVPDIEEPLDLTQFSGKWFFAAGTPINDSLSRCGRFLVTQTTKNTFHIKYTALSHKRNIPISFNVHGKVIERRIIGTWQFEGSKRKLGPFRHVIVFAKYDTVLGMLVCSENTSHQRGYKFVMIWSRERSLPLPIYEQLKTKLGAYVNQREIEMVDHGNC